MQIYKKINAFLFHYIFIAALATTFFSPAIAAEAAEPDGNFDITLGEYPLYFDAPVLYTESDYISFLFYNQLNENNKTVYETLSVLCNTPSDTDITISLPQTITMQVSSNTIGKWTDEEKETYYYQLIMAIQPGIVALTLDNPMLFWIDFNATAISPQDIRIQRNRMTQMYTVQLSTISIHVGYDAVYESIDTILEKKTELEQTITNFPITGETNAEKCASIHDALITQITYDSTADFMGSIAGSLLSPYHAVCEGYAKAFKVLCDSIQIPCITVVGNYNRENMTAHMWNYVMLDGAWYGVDTTWDDADPISYTYFLRGSQNFSNSHIPESVYPDITLSFPELHETDYYAETTTTIDTTTSTETITTIDATTSAKTITTIDTMTSTEHQSTSVTIPYCIGDSNQDGICTLTDYLLLRKFLVAVPGILCTKQMDCNEDGMINVLDAIYLFRILQSQCL